MIKLLYYENFKTKTEVAEKKYLPVKHNFLNEFTPVIK